MTQFLLCQKGTFPLVRETGSYYWVLIDEVKRGIAKKYLGAHMVRTSYA